MMKQATILPIFFIEGRGKTFFESVTSMGYEGIMAKRMKLFTFTRRRGRRGIIFGLSGRRFRGPEETTDRQKRSA